MSSSLFCRECVAALPLWDFALITGVSVIATVYLVLRSLRQFRRSRLVEDMPTSKIRSASQGYTELIGIARKGEHTNISPLSSQLCLWWHYKIERYQSSGKNRHWVTVENKRSDASFHIEDSTGICRVDPESAEMSTYHKRVWHGSTRRPVGGQTLKAKPHFLMTNIGGFGKRYRYTEYLLKDGDPLYVLGHFGTDTGGIRTLTPEQLAGDILRHWKQDFPALLKRFDINKDGELNADEWQLARHAAKWEAQDQHKEAQNEPEKNSLSQPVHKGLPFIISSHEQKKLGSKFRYSAILSALGFLMAGAMSTWLLSSRFLIN